MVTQGQGVSWSLNVDSTRGISVRFDFPDENDLRSYLLTFRQFIAPNEPIHVNRICNICFQGLKTNNDLRDYLIEAREDWKRALGKTGGGIRFEEQTLSTERVADLWINGYYFHSDMEKYEQLEKLLSYGLPYVKMHFANFVVDATKIIIYLGHLVEYARKNDLFKF